MAYLTLDNTMDHVATEWTSQWTEIFLAICHDVEQMESERMFEDPGMIAKVPLKEMAVIISSSGWIKRPWQGSLSHLGYHNEPNGYRVNLPVDSKLHANLA